MSFEMKMEKIRSLNSKSTHFLSLHKNQTPNKLRKIILKGKVYQKHIYQTLLKLKFQIFCFNLEFAMDISLSF